MSGLERQAAKRSWFGLLEAFLLFIVLLFLMDTALQYFISSSAASKASEEVLLQTAVAIEHKADAIRETTEFLLLQTGSFSERKAIDFSDFRSVNAFFMDHIKAHPHITSVNYGDTAGNGYLLLCAEDRWRNRIKKGTEEGIVTWVLTDNQGKILSRERRKDDYDPRVRPWYRNAAGSPGIHWSRPYIFRTTRDVGITASMAIESGKSQFPGVIGADVMLKDISRFFSDLKSRNKDLSIHLVSREGEILASSEVENFVRILRKDTSELPRISDGEFPDLATAFQTFGNLERDFLSFSSSGRSFYALRRPFHFSPDLKLSMILTVPQESLLSFFGSMNRVRIILYLVMIAVSGLFFVSRYLAPLRKLTRAAQTIGTGDYDPPPLSGRKDEVGVLVSEFSRMTDDLSSKQRELTSLINNVPGIVYRGHPDWSLYFIGAEVEQVTGQASVEFTSGAARWKEIVHPEDLGWLKDTFRKAVKEKSGTLHVEYRICHKDGGIRWIADRRQLIYSENGEFAYVDGLLLDITERRNLEGQLRQAMKMEAVGRLAGGVAHDFNNLLTAIMGNVSLALMKLSPFDPVGGLLAEANKAAERAARLTQQLLAFSRKQIIEPKILNINTLIADMSTMLVRLIGENIDMKTLPGEDLGMVKVDAGQFEQIMVNLAVNARDAMPDGGKLIIETANVDLDDDYCAMHEYVRPGRFVLLAVNDTGHGMSEEIKKQIFEPFFTTKPKGSGTGLGLSTIYGAVKQSGGSIEVYSEEGRGTTFKIFLPRVEGYAGRPGSDDGPQDLMEGSETVLLVEDEEIVRNLCVRMLERLGYTVLQASGGDEAIVIAKGHLERIDLLMTDVVMPGMNGRELADSLVVFHPETKVLFTSGYTDDAIVHHGVLNDGVAFIGKPYTLSELAKKVRGVLDKA